MNIILHKDLMVQTIVGNHFLATITPSDFLSYGTGKYVSQMWSYSKNGLCTPDIWAV